MNKKVEETMKAVSVTIDATTTAVGTVFGAVMKVIGTIILIGILTVVFFGFIVMAYINRYIIPNSQLDLGDFTLDETSFVYYQDPDTGEWVEWQELHSTENRVWVDYEDIPQDLIDATVAVEDHRFYYHSGVDWKRTFGVFIKMFLGGEGSTQGGSTLTQQLIKNLTGENEVTVKRKITEIFRALEFEKKYSKEEILEWYLNTVYLGQGCYGIGTAAKTYFNKEPSELTLAECASIIGITNAPTYYNPYYNYENNQERKEYILERMAELSIISEEECERAESEVVMFQPYSKTEDTTTTSYYLDAVIDDVIDDLMEEKNVTESVASQMLYRGGYRIYANIDMDIQDIVDSVFTDDDNFPDVTGNQDVLPQAAISISDPYTGKVVAMYGGRGVKTASRTWNRATMSTRQPGSAIKPITAYSVAIENGYITPNSYIVDGPLKKVNDNDWPVNYDHVYRGPITVDKAVQISNNAVAVKVVNMVSPRTCYEWGVNNMGLTTLVYERTGNNGTVYSDVDLAPLALGALTDGVTVEELTAAYTTFINGGTYYKPTTYCKVTDSEGNIVLDNTQEGTTAMKESTAYYMNLMLQHVVSSGTGTSARLGGGIATAGKTGTTTSDYDRWFVGYTPYYCAAVWFGYDTAQEINLTSSLNPALSLWRQCMKLIHEDLDSASFFTMDTVTAQYCEVTGMKPADGCIAVTGTFVKGTEPTEVCTGHEAYSDWAEWATSTTTTTTTTTTTEEPTTGETSPEPSTQPTTQPTTEPTVQPTVAPTAQPTQTPDNPVG